MTLYQAYVTNIGYLGDFDSKQEAIDAINETITSSGRADPHGFVLDSDDNFVAEIGNKSEG